MPVTKPEERRVLLSERIDRSSEKAGRLEAAVRGCVFSSSLPPGDGDLVTHTQIPSHIHNSNGVNSTKLFFYSTSVFEYSP